MSLSFALKIFDGRVRAAVKAPDELATLGPDCRPRRLKSLAIRSKEDYEKLSRSRRTGNYNQNDASANVRKSLDTTAPRVCGLDDSPSRPMNSQPLAATFHDSKRCLLFHGATSPLSHWSQVPR